MTTMIAKCPSCQTVFELDPAKVPIEGVRARCSVCSAVIVVPPRSAEVSSAQTAAPGSFDQAPPTPEVSPHSADEPLVETATSTSSDQVPPAPIESPTDEASIGNSAASTLTSTLENGAVETATDSYTDSYSPHPSIRAVEAPRRKPVNPFLTKDPTVRARRLARALVSDIVAYYPEKHAEALRDGTLKATFRDEIQKSFEEYVGQVGREFAESTAYFQEALNDVLAGGHKQF